jgi:hypothetical protein
MGPGRHVVEGSDANELDRHVPTPSGKRKRDTPPKKLILLGQFSSPFKVAEFQLGPSRLRKRSRVPLGPGEGRVLGDSGMLSP